MKKEITCDSCLTEQPCAYKTREGDVDKAICDQCLVQALLKANPASLATPQTDELDGESLEQLQAPPKDLLKDILLANYGQNTFPTDFRMRKQEDCSLHPNSGTSVCATCSIVICDKCILKSNHRFHNILDQQVVEKVVSNKLTELKHKVQLIKYGLEKTSLFGEEKKSIFERKSNDFKAAMAKEFTAMKIAVENKKLMIMNKYLEEMSRLRRNICQNAEHEKEAREQLAKLEEQLTAMEERSYLRTFLSLDPPNKEVNLTPETETPSFSRSELEQRTDALLQQVSDAANRTLNMLDQHLSDDYVIDLTYMRKGIVAADLKVKRTWESMEQELSKKSGKALKKKSTDRVKRGYLQLDRIKESEAANDESGAKSRNHRRDYSDLLEAISRQPSFVDIELNKQRVAGDQAGEEESRSPVKDVKMGKKRLAFTDVFNTFSEENGSKTAGGVNMQNRKSQCTLQGPLISFNRDEEPNIYNKSANFLSPGSKPSGYCFGKSINFDSGLKPLCPIEFKSSSKKMSEKQFVPPSMQSQAKMATADGLYGEDYQRDRNKENEVDFRKQKEQSNKGVVKKRAAGGKGYGKLKPVNVLEIVGKALVANNKGLFCKMRLDDDKFCWILKELETVKELKYLDISNNHLTDSSLELIPFMLAQQMETSPGMKIKIKGNNFTEQGLAKFGKEFKGEIVN
jgi:hypothetical protein